MHDLPLPFSVSNVAFASIEVSDENVRVLHVYAFSINISLPESVDDCSRSQGLAFIILMYSLIARKLFLLRLVKILSLL